MTTRRRHRLSSGRAPQLDRPALTRRQKAKVDRLSGIARALDLEVRLVMPQAHDAPAHLRLRGEHGECVHVVVFGSGEASRFAAPDSPQASDDVPPALSAELSARRAA